MVTIFALQEVQRDRTDYIVDNYQMVLAPGTRRRRPCILLPRRLMHTILATYPEQHRYLQAECDFVLIHMGKLIIVSVTSPLGTTLSFSQP